MKNVSLALAMLILLGATTEAGAMGPLDAQATVGVHGKYVWRGIIATDDPVLQADLSVGAAGLNFGLWGNMDLTDANMQKTEFSEFDWTLSYGVSLPKISLELGFIHYRYPDFPDGNTTEAFVGAQLNVPLSPSLTIYQDVDAVEGGYWEAGVSHAVPLSPATNLELSAGAGLGSQGYIQGYFGIDPDDPAPVVPGLTGGTSLTDAWVSAGVPFHPVPLLTVTPSVTFSTLMGDAGDAVDGVGGDKSAFVWAVEAGFSF